MEFGKQLLKLRKQKKLTQKELGDILKIGKTTISNYETGYSTPDANTLRKISDYFGVTTDTLLGRSNNIGPNESSSMLQRFIRFMKDESGASSSDNSIIIMFEILKVFAELNGINLNTIQDAELTSVEKGKLVEELDNFIKSQNDDPDKIFMEQYRNLPPQGQNAIKTMMAALQEKSKKTADD